MGLPGWHSLGSPKRVILYLLMAVNYSDSLGKEQHFYWLFYSPTSPQVHQQRPFLG